MAQAVVRGHARALERPTGLRYVAVVSGIAVLYVVTGRLGLSLAHFQENATLIWPPTGLSLAALVLFGRRVWPGVLVGAAITNAMIGTRLAATLGIAVGNTTEAVLAAFLLTRVAHFDSAFARLRDVIAFLLYGVLASTIVSASVGTGALHLTGAVEAENVGTVWLIWWLGDAGGATVVAPLLLVGLRGRPTWRAMAQRGETWGALAVLAVLVTLAFGGAARGPWKPLLLALSIFPVLVWVGLRLGPRGAIAGSFLAGTVAVVGTASGLGPFGSEDASISLFLLWAYVSTLGAVAMILAAAVAEREDADQARKQGEQERARLSAQMQHAQRLESLGRLAGGIAHDFNNLLVAIRGNAELLRLQPPLDSDRRAAMLGDIETASIRAADLCRQLLTYAGRSKPDIERLHLAQVVDETTSLLRTSLPRTVELRIATEDVPAIEGSLSQLGQILMNLVLNASESMEGQKGCVRVSLTSRDVDPKYLKETFLHSDAPGGRYVVLAVADDGKGMPPETLERIFDPFFTTKGTGRGLGMTNVLGIVQAHRGAIKVRSRPGEGSTFEVLFSAAPEMEKRAGEVDARPERPRPGGTVLIADDEAYVRELTRLVLETGGFVVLEACDGAEAVDLFRARRSEIWAVLLDMSMPGLGGIEALERIREISPDVPAVIMSGYDEGRAESAFDAVFVQKPFDVRLLLETVTEAVLRNRH